MKFNKNKTDFMLPYEYDQVYLEDINVENFGGFGGKLPISIQNEKNKINDFSDFEFDEDIRYADKLDYQLAAASGLLTAMINQLWVGEFSILEAKNWGDEKVEKYVIKVSQLKGYKGDTIKGAIRFLEDLYPMPGDELINEFGGPLQHHLRDFSHHPTPLGLAASILMQFIGKGFGTNTEGRFVTFDLPRKDTIGKDIPEKIIIGTVNWVMHLISDASGSSGAIGTGTGLPGPFLSFLKTLSVLPGFNKLTTNYNGEEITFPVWISKLFNGTHTFLNREGERVRFDLRAELGVIKHIGKSSLPVLANEAIVRAMYFLRTLNEVVQEQEVSNFKQLLEIDPKLYLPYNTRRLQRMLTISSGTFFVVTTSVTAVKSINNKQNLHPAGYILLNMNYFGLFRFGLAIKNDFNFIVEDIEKVRQDYLERQFTVYDNANLSEISGLFTLNDEQTRLLNNLKYQTVKYDIDKTKDDVKQLAKKHWLSLWKESFVASYLEKDSNYLFEKEEDLFLLLEKLNTGDSNWKTLVIIELINFSMYYRLNKNDLQYKGIKQNTNYIEKVFLRRQSVINKSKYNSVLKENKKALKAITETNKNLMIGAGAIALAGVATGGAAYIFAPEIAVAIVGNTFVGLKGAALTNASLAMLGGGSLAAGGLGMAGGTSLIVGGGSLLSSSLATLGAMSLIASKSSQFILNESAKILTFTKEELVNLKNHQMIVTDIYKALLKQIHILKMELDEKVNSEEKIPKKEVRNMKKGVKYLENTSKLILNLISIDQKEDSVYLLESS